MPSRLPPLLSCGFATSPLAALPTLIVSPSLPESIVVSPPIVRTLTTSLPFLVSTLVLAECVLWMVKTSAPRPNRTYS